MSEEKFSPVNRPAPQGLRRVTSLFLATGAGLGYSPIASGTVGTLWGIVLVWMFHGVDLSVLEMTMVTLALCLVAVPVCQDAEAVFARKDDRRIVADEYVTFPLCMLGLEMSWFTVIVAFLTHRIFDIVKLPPARRFQQISGGSGIVLDDVAAALYSLLANHIILWGWKMLS